MTKKFTLSTFIAGTIVGAASYLIINPKELTQKIIKGKVSQGEDKRERNDDFIFI